jgi:hypothetical protein
VVQLGVAEQLLDVLDRVSLSDQERREDRARRWPLPAGIITLA